MGCTHHADLAKAPRPVISVNGVVVPHQAISRETQNHAARTPAAAWHAAARALVLRELLLQRARSLEIVAVPQCDDKGRRETDEEALIRALFEREVVTPEPDEECCRRYFDRNRGKFRSPDIYEAAHILFAASRKDREAFARKRADAEMVLAALLREPERFADMAKAHSACPSAKQGGNLGQITAGQTTLEFERALATLEPGTMTQALVETRYGLHIIRLDRRIDGRELSFELVAQSVASYLRETASLRAHALYVRTLAEQAHIDGLQFEPARPQSSA